MLSDLHFGKYNNDEWLFRMEDYFYNFFIPVITKYKKANDVLVILGDIFDNRNSINLKAINIVIKLFEDLAKIIDIHILIGNHDMYLMNDNSINSVSVIRNIDGITIYDKPTNINFDGLDVLMMPWINGKNNEIDVLDNNTADLLFCHSDLNGCRTQLHPTRPHNRNILNIDDFKGYEHIYSGHIHIRQKIKNFTFVGSPYHLDRNDVENRKGIYIFDTKTKTDFLIENNYSPEFKKIKIISESDFKELKTVLDTKDFIDVSISNELLVKKPELRLEFDKLANKYKISNLEFIDDIVKDKKNIKPIENIDIKKLSIEWVNNLSIDNDIKIKMLKTIEKCYTMI